MLSVTIRFVNKITQEIIENTYACFSDSNDGIKRIKQSFVNKMKYYSKKYDNIILHKGDYECEITEIGIFKNIGFYDYKSYMKRI